MVAQRLTILFALAALLAPIAEAFAPKSLPTCPAKAAPSKDSSLSVYNSYGYGRDWDYDYGGGLAFGTSQYRQRYNDGYSGGVNLSHNGYSQQTNVARGGYGGLMGRYSGYDDYGYGGGYGGRSRYGGGYGRGRGGYDDYDDYGYGGYGGMGRGGMGRGGMGSFYGRGRGRGGGGYYDDYDDYGYGGYGGRSFNSGVNTSRNGRSMQFNSEYGNRLYNGGYGRGGGYGSSYNYGRSFY